MLCKRLVITGVIEICKVTCFCLFVLIPALRLVVVPVLAICFGHFANGKIIFACIFAEFKLRYMNGKIRPSENKSCTKRSFSTVNLKTLVITYRPLSQTGVWATCVTSCICSAHMEQLVSD